ncbi:MAG: aromatic ring-hydroxylating dioxygenase subunit alpha [Methylocaldum sp.]|jgi:phenylpropionate dioxygenase-like ring-hydroxylating dioxygenase large terminal subunit|uniref:Rieske 2Fe-2S domain-containing protein n=1 Tax=Methylocaldum sp. GT1BB TaxID=3438963 RepID=UPI0012EBC0C8|nr:aromatic ring-hydroxylating dioxygenase subunit alpha [Methylocaldum sp.]MVF21575.1 aromatic ring-hydroxylating dioxygenase subunit alpha [Methylocaldum sp. BRCS4]
MSQLRNSQTIPDLRKMRINPDYWYPLAWAHQVGKAKVLGAVFAGRPIAIARTQSGKIFALEDRCAHRQFPLSLGVVCGDHLQCGYHAWRYDQHGRISAIPYAGPDTVPPPGVRSYPCREAYGAIFVFPGHPDLADQVPLPEIALRDSPDYKPMCFSRQVDCHYSFMHENLMDMNHQFLHRRLMGKIRPELLGTARGDGWVEARYHFHHLGGRRHSGSDLLSFGGDHAEKEYDVMTIRTEYPYQTLTIAGRDSEFPSVGLWCVYVPKDPDQKTNQSFGILMIRKPRIPGLIHVLWPLLRHFAEAVFAEDRMAVEAEQRAYDELGRDRNQEVYPVTLAVRELLISRGIAPKPDECG